MEKEADQFAEENARLRQINEVQEKEYSERIAKLTAEIRDSKPVAPPKLSYHIELDEDETRLLIDEQLKNAGWEADSQQMRQANGERPEAGKNKAIAEWKTTSGRADYVLFVGLTPLAIVEAKPKNTDIAGKIDQSERYSRDFILTNEMQSAKALAGRLFDWGSEQAIYHIPFVYSANGRGYVKQLAEKSGIWFRDVRKPSNLKTHLPEFHTPDGLLDKLQRDEEDAHHKLAQEPFSYLSLRDYQQKAVQAVEAGLANGQKDFLLAMATGTGKTYTIIALIYRFLKAERFKRILFLVDRTALGIQATNSFLETPLEQNQSLSEIYNIAGLGEAVAAETRIHASTVQALVKRIDYADPHDVPPIDQYDCIIVDEAHRGYTLDQDMTDGELLFRDEKQYQSSYRRVLEYFDAVKIGLTATPAKHTTEIFGEPVFVYSYREAVADDWLIDYEPPIRYETQLSQNGIHYSF